MADLQPLSDADLSMLHQRYHAPLMAFFIRRVRNHAEAQDLTQEVFTRLARGRQVEHADAYVFQTAANLLRDRDRRERVRSNYRAMTQGEEGGVDLLSPERVVASRQALNHVISALQALPARTRAIFILHRLERLTKAEIAEMFELSISGIDKHLVKAIVHLHTRLKDVP